MDLISISRLTPISISRSLSPGRVLRYSPGPLRSGRGSRVPNPTLMSHAMARRPTHDSNPRTKQVLIRLTPDEYLRRAVDARKAGLTVSGLCERLVTQGKVEAVAASGHRPMHPAYFAELRRIGNNANQIAHALNSNLPPDVQFAWRTALDLLQLLAREELRSQQALSERPRSVQQDPANSFTDAIAQALRTRTQANDPPTPQARDIFQRRVQVHPARRGQGHE